MVSSLRISRATESVRTTQIFPSVDTAKKVRITCDAFKCSNHYQTFCRCWSDQSKQKVLLIKVKDVKINLFGIASTLEGAEF